MTFSSNEPGSELEKELTRLRPDTPRLSESFRLSLRQRLRQAPVPSPAGEHITMMKLNRFAAAAAVLVIVLLVGVFVRSYISGGDLDQLFQPGQSGETDQTEPTVVSTEIVPTATVDHDWDEDGLLLSQESEYQTDPLNADTDGDGLNDGDEVHQYATDPLHGDTDDDGALDGDEVQNLQSSPLNADSDADGLLDGVDPDPIRAATTLSPTAVPDTEDAVWIEAVTPVTGSALVGPGAIPVTITVGYALNTVDSAELLVQIQRPNGDGSGYGLGETTTTLSRGRGSLTLTVVINNPAEVGAEPRTVGLLVTLWNINAEKLLFMDFPAGYEWLVMPEGE